MRSLSLRSLQHRAAALPARCSRPAPHVNLLRGHTRRRLVPCVAQGEPQQAVDEQPERQNAEPVAVPAPDSLLQIDPELVDELELLELEEAQEHLLKWLMLDKTAQDEDLDEMIDYDAFDDEEYADMYEEVEHLLEAVDYDLNVGDMVTGTVVEIEDQGAYVDIGAKALAFCPVTECSFARLKTPLEAVRPGMRREFLVVEDEQRYGQAIVSLAALEAATCWGRIRQFRDEDVAVCVRVESVTRGGLGVRLGPFDGFVPMGQLGQIATPDSVAELIGQELRVKILEADEERERLIFTCRGSGGEIAGGSGSFQSGDLVSGVVQDVKPYGAFVDLGGGVTALLHVSQVSSDRITMLDRVLAEGDRIRALVLHRDERGRVAISTKKLEPTPGDMLRDPNLVYEKAEEMAAMARKRIEDAAGAQAADSYASGLGAPLGDGPYVY